LVLPVAGLVLFAGVTYDSLTHVEQRGRYFWWSSIQLDSDPPNGRHQALRDSGVGWTVESRWDEPGLLTLLLLPALPAFVAGVAVFRRLGRLGISEVVSFFVSMPLLVSAWYYFIGWLIDRWRGRRQPAPAIPRAGSM
jgi:hypothetical protein